MKAEKVIKYRLGNFAGVTALVGDRVYPGALPQNPQLPAIVYKRAASRRLKGAHSDPGIAYVTLQVICVGAKEAPADDVLALNEQVRLALERYGWSIAGGAVDGVIVYDIQIGSEAQDYDAELDAHVISTDYTVNHKE
jgi:hypothetical protein